ncbi:hypothetical protein JW960_07735 [candidate division KSB1 bacterium]|nr:hypothetical protein [candidate division KSB1 bacterium]
MDQLVFKSDTAAQTIQKYFVAIKIDKKHTESNTLKSRYNVRGYPTIIVANDNGDEIDRVLGFDGDGVKFLQTIVDYANGKNTLAALNQQLTSSPDDIDLNYRIAQKYDDRYEFEKAGKYFEAVLKLDPKDAKGYNNESKYILAIYAIITDKNFQPLESFLQKTDNHEYLLDGYSTLANQYAKIKQFDNAVAAYEKAMQKLPDNARLMNGYAWFVFEKELKNNYQHAIAVARKAVKLETKAAYIRDTLAQLLHANIQQDEAIAEMRKAAETAPNDKYYQEMLDKYLKSGKASK